jgi:heme A synthase
VERVSEEGSTSTPWAWAIVILLFATLLLGAIVLGLQAPFKAGTDTSCSWPLFHLVRGYDGDQLCGTASRSRLWASLDVIVVWLTILGGTVVSASRSSARNRRNRRPGDTRY